MYQPTTTVSSLAGYVLTNLPFIVTFSFKNQNEAKKKRPFQFKFMLRTFSILVPFSGQASGVLQPKYCYTHLDKSDGLLKSRSKIDYFGSDQNFNLYANTNIELPYFHISKQYQKILKFICFECSLNCVIICISWKVTCWCFPGGQAVTLTQSITMYGTKFQFIHSYLCSFKQIT